jgi:hypothetical protein
MPHLFIRRAHCFVRNQNWFATKKSKDTHQIFLKAAGDFFNKNR